VSWVEFLRGGLWVNPPELSPEERKSVEAAFGHASELLGSTEVVEDRSPVMSSSEAFLAKLEHQKRVIVLNGHFLDRTPESLRSAAREFLVFHELSHLILGENERLCDCLGMLAVEKRVALRD
jgi:hypothetical protein